MEIFLEKNKLWTLASTFLRLFLLLVNKKQTSVLNEGERGRGLLSMIHFKQVKYLLFLCECGRAIKGMNECFIVPCYSAVSGAGPPKVKLGAGMKAISSLALTKCELGKSLESLLLLYFSFLLPLQASTFH